MTDDSILEILKKCHDLSSMSVELPSWIVDRASEFHLSPARANLLRPFAFSPDDSVLEVGADCGALTRWLAEGGAHVVAMESDRAGAMCVAERCRDLPNVSAVYRSFADLPNARAFTAVTCIGSLQRAGEWLRPGRTAVDMLRHMADCLTPNGLLFLAIENQLGFKYLCGSTEHQTGTSYFGVNDLYNPAHPGTYGKHELTELLRSCGFTSLEWYYPFPDHRLPTLIISEAGLEHPVLNVADLLSDVFSLDYSQHDPPLMWEPLAWRVISRNRLLGELSNSFFVVARKQDAPMKGCSTSWLAKRYRTVSGQLQSKETTFMANDGTILIVRRRLVPSDAVRAEDSANPFGFRHVLLQDNRYVPGELYGPELYKILAREGTVDEIVRWMRPWVNFLEVHAIPSTRSSKDFPASLRWVPGHLIDCVPFNLIYDSEGRLRFIDWEFQSSEPIPLPWVIARGLFYRLNLCLQANGRLPLTYRSLLDEVFTRLGIEPTDELYSVVARFENALIDFIYQSRERHELDFAICLSWQIGRADRTESSRQLLAEFERVKKTLGWRVLSLYWGAVDRAFPWQSRRRRVLDRFAGLCRRLTGHTA